MAAAPGRFRLTLYAREAAGRELTMKRRDAIIYELPEFERTQGARLRCPLNSK